MPVLKYADLGPERKLHDIVMAGSHDAGITKGGKNAKTQNMDIYLQATAGVRIFDIRITGAIITNDKGKKQATLSSYHGVSLPIIGKSTNVYNNLHTKRTDAVTTQSLAGGTFGMGLGKMLRDAKQFVSDNPSEFLFLKFDKCTNWKLIAELCIEVLGDKIGIMRGNLNQKTLRELAGNVFVLFPNKGLNSCELQHPNSLGILEWQNLSKDSEETDLPDGNNGYKESHNGLQYFGGGGTAPGAFWRGFTAKMKENIKKQAKKMQKGAATDPRVLGMMYWTATGINESIKKRNDFLWNDQNRLKMIELWETRIPKNVDTQRQASAALLKQFMANFVMIDFADAVKCKQIYDLNALGAQNMQGAVRDWYDVQEPLPRTAYRS